MTELSNDYDNKENIKIGNTIVFISLIGGECLMYNIDPYAWYERDRKKKKERERANDISLINRQLQQLLNEVKHKINWKKYEKVANILEYRHRVKQSSLWNLSWANNFEDKEVALAQGVLIYHIIKNEELTDSALYLHRVDKLMKRLGSVDSGVYLKYCQLKDSI